MTNPLNLNYCKVYGNFKAFVADGGDDDDLPDFIPMSGTGSIYPNVDLVKNTNPDEKAVYFNSPISVIVDADGDLSLEGNKYVMLLASSPDINPADFNYSVTLSLTAQGESDVHAYGPFIFNVTPGGELDLADIVPVAKSGGTPIIQGPAGPEGPAGEPGPAGAGVPSGGTALQLIRKNSANTTTEWVTADKTLVGLSNVDNTADTNKPVSSATQTALNGKEPSIVLGTAAQYWRGDKTWVTLDKTAVGLANVDNTSDANKPVSTAVSTQLALLAPLASPTFTGTVGGITKAMVGLANVDNTSDVNKPVSTAAQTALNGKEPSIVLGTSGQYWRGDKTWATLDKTAVGLNNVDNTSDVNKPVSTAAQTALNGKEPSIVLGTAAQYWRGDKTWVTLDKSAVGLANVDNTSDVNKPVSSATQTALNGKANSSHTHDTADIISGTIAVARLPLVTTAANGIMLSTDKVKLDSSSSAASASTLILRDSSGRAQVTDPSAAADIATKNYVDTMYFSHWTSTSPVLASSGYSYPGTMTRDTNLSKNDSWLTMSTDIWTLQPGVYAMVVSANAGTTIPADSFMQMIKSDGSFLYFESMHASGTSWVLNLYVPCFIVTAATSYRYRFIDVGAAQTWSCIFRWARIN